MVVTPKAKRTKEGFDLATNNRSCAHEANRGDEDPESIFEPGTHSAWLQGRVWANYRALTQVHILESGHIREQVRYSAAQLHVAGQAANQHVKLVQVVTIPSLAASETRHEWRLQCME